MDLCRRGAEDAEVMRLLFMCLVVLCVLSASAAGIFLLRKLLIYSITPLSILMSSINQRLLKWNGTYLTV